MSPPAPQPAQAGLALHIGDEISVGPQSSATPMVGGCGLELPAQTEMQLLISGGNICVAVADGSSRMDDHSTVGGPHMDVVLFSGWAVFSVGASVILDLGDRTRFSP